MFRVSAAVLAAGLALAPGAQPSPPPAPPAPAPAPPGAAQTVLPPLAPGAGALPTALGIERVLAPLLKEKALASYGIAIVDASTGQLLFGRRPAVPYIPASVTKVLTAAAVLATLGPDATLKTRVVRVPAAAGTAPPAGADPSATAPSDAAPPEIVLVGAGDPGLSSLPAGSDVVRPWLPPYPRRTHLDTLAGRTADKLKADGVTRVRLRYDTSLFSGPTASPTWPSTYTSSGVVAPVTALSADQGRSGPLDYGRVSDPAGRTSAVFARLLEERGIRVAGGPRTAMVAPPEAAQVAAVESPPVAALVEHMLVASDNDYAEALARQVAVARGVAANFENSAAAVRAVVAEIGAPLDGVVTHDGSGLSRANRIPPQMLGQLLGLAATGPDLRLRVLVAGLAVAGVNGTLDTHYFEPRSVASAGLVRAKSGSLSGVTSLAGVLPVASGRLLAFAVEANDVRNGFAARLTIERMTAALLTCGCTDAP